MGDEEDRPSRPHAARRSRTRCSVSASRAAVGSSSIRSVRRTRPARWTGAAAARWTVAAAIAQHGVQSLGKACDVVVGAGDVAAPCTSRRSRRAPRSGCCPARSCRTARFPAVQSRRLLAGSRGRSAADRPSIGDAAAVGIEQTVSKLDQRALAATGGPTMAVMVPGVAVKLTSLQHRAVRLVGEAHVVETDLVLEAGHGDGIRRVLHLRLDVEDLEHPVEPHRHVLRGRPVAHQPAHLVARLNELACAHWNAPRFQRTKLRPTKPIRTAANVSRLVARPDRHQNSPPEQNAAASVNMTMPTTATRSAPGGGVERDDDCPLRNVAARRPPGRTP